MKVENIKKSGKKYKIVFDNDSKMTTYDDVIINNGLLYHKEVTHDLLNQLNIDHHYYDIYYKTINYITRKLRSEKEIGEYIDKFAVTNQDKKEVIQKLKEIGYINDVHFVQAFIADKIHLSNDGPYKIKNDLLCHHIEEEVIDEYLNKIDEKIIIDKLNKIITKKQKSSNYTGFKLKQKITNELINLGYELTMIQEIYCDKPIDNNIEEQYQKLYQKLSLKYKDEQLKLKIKQKLYQKGYTIEDINKVINL